VNRLVYALPLLVSAVSLSLSVAAASSPSPDLAQILVAPPSGFTQVTVATLHGHFTAETFGTTYGTQAGEAANALTHDGFVDGYGMTWYQASTGRALVEFVIAFEGGKGARSWLLYEQASDQNEQHYQHADSMAGIDPYYGVHLTDPSSNLVGDAFSFVKGNDMFGVGFVSPTDDVLDLAVTQAKSQYDSAPSQTIAPAQWPENSVAGSLQSLSPPLSSLLLILVAFGLVAILVSRSRRRVAVPAQAGHAPAHHQPPPPGGLVQLAPDGNTWWDGHTWRDSLHEAPPFAQRSTNGRLWWDGLRWRPVPPRAPTPPS
jgi:hypothetical protein